MYADPGLSFHVPSAFRSINTFVKGPITESTVHPYVSDQIKSQPACFPLVYLVNFFQVPHMESGGHTWTY